MEKRMIRIKIYEKLDFSSHVRAFCAIISPEGRKSRMKLSSCAYSRKLRHWPPGTNRKLFVPSFFFGGGNLPSTRS
jgi:hypothetical protein